MPILRLIQGGRFVFGLIGVKINVRNFGNFAYFNQKSSPIIRQNLL